MGFTLSPNMFLRIPGVGTEQGPDYAIDINFDLLSVLDAHDHSPGRGVAITPAGLNINSTLSINNNFITDIAGLTLFAQSATPAVNTIYQLGLDLYFVDGVGNNVRITQSGGVAGTPGSITNLTPPASVNYVAGSQTFIFQSNTNIAANLDAGALYLRNLTPNSTYAVRLEPPAGLVADYTITLPITPASTKIVTIDPSGAMQSTLYVDNSTIKVLSNQLVVQGQSIPNSAREHNWELNGKYDLLAYPLNNIDAIFFAPYNIVINSVWIYCGDLGTSGTTEFDLKVKSPGGSFASILSTTGKVTAAATPIALTSVTTTATATLANHGFGNGATVVISGATEVNYNGTFVVSNVTTNTFDYTMSGTAASPATGSPVVRTPTADVWTDSGSIVATQVGVTKPVLSTVNINAGQAIRFDLIQSMVGSPSDARIRIFYTQA